MNREDLPEAGPVGAMQIAKSPKPGTTRTLPKTSLAIALATTALLASTTAAALEPTPPIAAKRDHAVVAAAGTRNDEYYWLRDDTRKDPEMLAYLAAENAYANAVLAPLKPLQEKIYKEITDRIKQDDSTVPFRQRGYWYYSRYEPGKEYAIIARRRGSMQADEEILLDNNALSKGHEFFQIGDWVVSQDNRMLAYAVDLTGRRQFELRFLDLDTGKLLADTVTNAEASFMWADDNKTVFYIDKDPVSLLSKRVKRHVLGTDASDDTLVYEEADDSFYMGIGRTRSDDYLCIFVSSTVSSEQRCTSAKAPGEFKVLAPRQRDFEYQADHLGGRWVIQTNWDAPNYRVMTVADADAWGSRDAWAELVPHSKDVFINGIEPFDGFLAISERSEGLSRIRVLKPDGSSELVKSDEAAYTMGSAVNAEPDSDWLRYTYTSLTTPLTTYELNTKTGERKLLKRDPVLGGFDPAAYVTERVWATARDGAKIPVSLVYRKGFVKDGTAPMYQYAYGSYGSSSEPRFNLVLPSLLDRGVVYALAHVRGGQEMGRAWYDAGHLMQKKNTFTDFIDVTRHLVAEGYAAKDRVAAEGRSAGGLLMGAIANMAPDDYQVIVAGVPFVDVVTTMLDESIPLTTNEFDEWGNPVDKAYYDYMLSYSPYDNIAAHDYPALYVHTGLNDSQVQYFEPAKWVARLRDRKTGTQPLVFRVNMEAGHGGKAGRFQRYKEYSESYAFVLGQLGITQ
jgi:oligopeptidase B